MQKITNFYCFPQAQKKISGRGIFQGLTDELFLSHQLSLST